MNFGTHWYNLEADETFVTILLVILAVWLLCLLWALAQYILRSISLFSIAKRRGIPNYGLAWVPVAYLWTLGSIADQYDASRGLTRKWRHVLLWLTISALAVYIVAYAGILASMFATAFASLGNTFAAPRQRLDPAMYSGLLLACIGLVPYILLILGRNICQWVCYYKLFESSRPAKAVLLLLLSTLVPFAAPFCLLACRNKDQGMPGPGSQANHKAPAWPAGAPAGAAVIQAAPASPPSPVAAPAPEPVASPPQENPGPKPEDAAQPDAPAGEEPQAL